MADSDTVSEQLFVLPDNPKFKEDPEGIEFSNHLFASETTGKAKITLNLNGWEKELIDYESQQPDFVCWLRNPNRASWGLCIPYEYQNETKGFHPDFLVISRRNDSYVVDILEPHGDQFDDNLAKAKGLAKYAKKEDRFRRIQLIRKIKDNVTGKTRFIRLEFNDREIREKVLQANTNDELRNIILNYGTAE